MDTIRQKLKSGEPSIGSWMQVPSASVAEIMGRSGFDWVAIDLEHGSFSLDLLPDICRALELGGTAPFARVARNTAKDIKQALDAGVRGIIVPMIENREEMEHAAAWAQYPPEGQRGVGFSRANLFGRGFGRYFSSINDTLVLVAQIESIGAVRVLDAILSVERVDAMIIGPYDLSASMGLTGQFEHPDFLAAVALAGRKAREHGVALGMHVVQPDPAVLKARIADGFQFIAYGIDAVFLLEAAANPLRARPAG